MKLWIVWRLAKRLLGMSTGGVGMPGIADRRIYSYFDGTRSVRTDPMDIHRRLIEKGGEDWLGLLRQIRAHSIDMGDIGETIARQRAKALADCVQQLTDLARHAFSARPFADNPDGSTVGLLDSECIDLLYHYLAWVDDVTREYQGFRNSPPSTG